MFSQIWSKQIEARAAEMDFANLQFQGELIDSDGNTQVQIGLDRKPKSSMKYDKCSEKITVKKSNGGGYLYLGGKTDVIEANNEVQKKVTIRNMPR